MQLLIQFAGGRDLRLSSSSTNVSHKKTFRIGSKCIPLTYIFLRCVLIAGRQGDEKITGERCRARIIQPEGIKSNFFFGGGGVCFPCYSIWSRWHFSIIFWLCVLNLNLEMRKKMNAERTIKCGLMRAV